MKISTRISHARLRIKHNFLRLRIQKPLYYKTLAVLVLVFAVGGMLSAYHFYFKKGAEVSGEQAELEIESYSLNGEVVSIAGNRITVKVGVLQNQGSDAQFIYQNKIVILTASTQIAKIKVQNGQVTSSTGRLDDLTPGKSVAVYTSASPDQATQIQADKIEIIEQ